MEEKLSENELRKYLGVNANRYYKYLKKYNSGKKFFTFNWYAFFLTPIWGTYRKMWGFLGKVFIIEYVLFAFYLKPEIYTMAPNIVKYSIWFFLLSAGYTFLYEVFYSKYHLLKRAKEAVKKGIKAESDVFTISMISILFYLPMLYIVTPLFLNALGGLQSPQNLSNRADESKPLHIVTVMYNDNQTKEVNDDKLYIYFNKTIDENTTKEEVSQLFKVEGVGKIGSGSVMKIEEKMFHRVIVFLNNKGTKSEIFKPNKTRIALVENKIKALSKGAVSTEFCNINPFNLYARLQNKLPKESDLQRGIERKFTKGNDTVTDEVTKLMWENTEHAIREELSYNKAVDYCQELRLDSYSNWKIPSIQELNTISHEKILKYNEEYKRYWSSSIYATKSLFIGRTFSFKIRTTNIEDKSLYGKNFIRCMRDIDEKKSLIKEIRYIEDNKNHIVIDTSSNLLWRHQKKEVENKSAKSAISYCKSLNFKGYGDWYLPTFNELYSLVNNVNKNTPNDFFVNTKHRYWIDEYYLDGVREYYYVVLTDGTTSAYRSGAPEKFSLRCTHIVD